MNALRGNMASQERTCAYIIRRWEQAKAWRWNKLNLGLPRGSESNMALPDFGDGRGTRGVRGDLMLEGITSECVCSPVYPSELSAPALVKQTAETRLGIFLSRISIGRLFLWTLWCASVGLESRHVTRRTPPGCRHRWDSVSKAKVIDQRK